jgi:hypothetical protein
VLAPVLILVVMRQPAAMDTGDDSKPSSDSAEAKKAAEEKQLAKLAAAVRKPANPLVQFMRHAISLHFLRLLLFVGRRSFMLFI